MTGFRAGKQKTKCLQMLSDKTRKRCEYKARRWRQE